MTGTMLFCVLIRLIGLQLAVVRSEIKRQMITTYPPNVEIQRQQELRLGLMRKKHLLICKAVRRLSDHFGVFLMIVIGSIFVGVTNAFTYVLMTAMSQYGPLIGVLYGSSIVDQLIQSLLLVYFCDCISDEVIYLYLIIEFVEFLCNFVFR